MNADHLPFPSPLISSTATGSTATLALATAITSDEAIQPQAYYPLPPQAQAQTLHSQYQPQALNLQTQFQPQAYHIQPQPQPQAQHNQSQPQPQAPPSPTTTSHSDDRERHNHQHQHNHHHATEELRAFISNRKDVWTFTLQHSARSLTPALRQRLHDALSTFSTATRHMDVADVPALSSKLHAIDDKVSAHWSRVLASPVAFADLRFHMREIIELIFIGYAIDYIHDQNASVSPRAIKRGKNIVTPTAPSQAYDPNPFAGDGAPLPRRLKASEKSRDLALDELQIVGSQRARVMDLIKLVAAAEEAASNGGGPGEMKSTLQPYLDAGDWKKLEWILDADEVIMVNLLKDAKALDLQFAKGLNAYKSNITQIRDQFRVRYIKAESRNKLIGTKVEKIRTGPPPKTSHSKETKEAKESGKEPTKEHKDHAHAHDSSGKGLNLKEVWKMFIKEATLKEEPREERRREMPRPRDGPREERHTSVKDGSDAAAGAGAGAATKAGKDGSASNRRESDASRPRDHQPPTSSHTPSSSRDEKSYLRRVEELRNSTPAYIGPRPHDYNEYSEPPPEYTE